MPAAITIRIDAREALHLIRTLGDDVPYWTAAALNRTAEDGAAAVRAHLPQAFHLRVPGFARWVAPYRLPPEDRATKQRLLARVQTERIGRILDPYEIGLLHGPDRLGRWPAIPSPALRPSPLTMIPRRLYPQALGLVPMATPRGTARLMRGRGSLGGARRGRARLGARPEQGRHRTYLVPLAAGGRAIFQRTGRGQSRLLWTLVPAVRRPPVLRYEATIRATVAQRWQANLSGMIDAALRQRRRVGR
jgi:hypothetical protein